jgi:AdoMet-dependent rRNA methyltransferase SPB1
MGFNKSTGKGRLDKYYHLAKEKGYRARAAFKLIQLNQKYHVLEKSRVLIDLCAAPGSWCQVAAEVMPVGSLIVGVDLSPIKSIPRTITFQSDITTDKCRATLRQHLKTFKADTVLHDGAPNVGTAWVQDAFSQAELVLQSLRLATDFLAPGGSFITKIFRSKDYNSLLWVFNQLFEKVEATKPPSSRNVSAEIFVVCLGYKAPKKIDPRFLDPKAVFAELPAAAPNNEAKVFNPEVKKRKREGYEDGDYTQFKEAPASEFIQTTDPIAMLGSLNKLSLDQQPNGDIALATLNRLPETTDEIRACCADLKVLGRKDFKLLLRWRLKVREVFGFATKKKMAEEAAEKAKAAEEVAEIEDMDDELRMQDELQRLKDQSDTKKKKEKRKENDRKRKEIVRMQMNMTTPMEIGIEQAGPYGEDSLFAMKTIDKSENREGVLNGKMHSVLGKQPVAEDDSDDDSSDEEGDALEAQLDAMYTYFSEKRAEADAKYKAKKARKEHDDNFEDFSDREEVSDDEDVVKDDDSDDESDAEPADDKPLFYGAKDTVSGDGLSKRASMFFDQDIFKGIDGLDGVLHTDSGIDVNDSSSADETKSAQSAPSAKPTKESKKATEKKTAPTASDAPARDTKIVDGIEVVRHHSPNPWADDAREEPVGKDGRPDIDIITAEAMTLAHDIAMGKTSRATLLDDSFNKYSLRDVDGLPDWFLDDETRHSKLQRPITAAGAAAIKEKLRALNARPIKKVREAKDRKKFKAAQRLEKLKKKSALLIEDEGLTERDKARDIEKMMAKAAKKRPQQKVTLVVARGGNRGISGRPKGTKGKYKMVDARMKKDLRGLRRAKKRNGT